MSSTVGRLANAGRVLTWEPGRGLVPCAHEDDQLLIADSWLVSDGRVRGLERHRQRFFRACIEVAHIPQDHLHAFWRATVRELPRHERWFPRVELSARPRAELRLRIRPAPPQGAAVRLWVWDGPDPRTAPRQRAVVGRPVSLHTVPGVEDPAWRDRRPHPGERRTVRYANGPPAPPRGGSRRLRGVVGQRLAWHPDGVDVGGHIGCSRPGPPGAGVAGSARGMRGTAARTRLIASTSARSSRVRRGSMKSLSLTDGPSRLLGEGGGEGGEGARGG